MEIASAKSLAQIVSFEHLPEGERLAFFFRPREELAGGSIFSKFASNYEVIHKYLEQVDEATVDLVNRGMRSLSCLFSGAE